MSMCALSCEELMAYNEAMTKMWREWFAQNRTALETPCDVMNVGSVRLLVQHIFAVELRYTQRLLEQPMSSYDELPSETAEDLFAIHDRAMTELQSFLASTNAKAMEEVIEVKTRSAGTLKATRRTIFLHAMIHSVRHWAQLATVVRQAGYPGVGWQDYLFFGLVS